MEADPIGLKGGSNPYAYANNNPISNVDPNGLEAYTYSSGYNFFQNTSNFRVSSTTATWPRYVGAGLSIAEAGLMAIFSTPFIPGDTYRDDTKNNDSRDPWFSFYHGTSVTSATALAAGTPLSANAAAELKFSGREKGVGFYLATNMDDATYFAFRNLPPALIQVTMQKNAIESLTRAGARLQPIGGGANFAGQEFFIPPKAFPTFDKLRMNQKIHIRLMNQSEWY